MTDTFDLAAMIADREAGTPGKWVVPDQTYRGNLTVELDLGPDDERRLVECPGSGGAMSFTDEICTLGWRGTGEWMANSRRISRVPEMEAEILRLREGLEAIRQYGSDTLDGPSEGTPDDREWQRAGVLEMTDRADRVLSGEPWKKEDTSHD